MPTWLKVVLIIVACFIVLGIGAVIAGVYWWNTSGKAFIEQSGQAMKDGQEFGRNIDDNACVPETLTRYKKKEKGIMSAVGSKLFLTGCLQSSHSTPNFCNDVPRRLEFTKSATWLIDQCKDAGLGEDQNCQQIFQAVQEHCEKVGSSSSN